MIAYVKGTLTYKDPAYVIVEAAGVGYEIKVSLQTFGALPNPGEACKVYTFQQIREDAHVLFGFAEPDEKFLFLDLVSVSGVGPSTALVMLSSMSSLEIRQAIVNEDVRTIQTIKGIGGKTAQRVVIDLKDKIKKEAMLAPTQSNNLFVPTNGKVRNEALAALVMLGIPKQAAEKSIEVILKREGDSITVEQLIKLALR
jgi:holliday junction DNA helicase RuvA